MNKESTIYAIDKDISLLKIILPVNGVLIEPIDLDFENAALPFKIVDGIMMSNSLHFVKNKKSFLEKIKRYLNKNSDLLIVEYDTNVSNGWVPYPISFLSLKKLFYDAGFASVAKIDERPSSFNKENLYSATGRNQSGGDRQIVN